MLVTHDNACKSIWTLEVDHKGVDTHVGVVWLNDKLIAAGYAGVKITVKSDNEPVDIGVYQLACAQETSGDGSNQITGQGVESQ